MSTWLQIFTAYPGIWSDKSYARFRPTKYPKSLPKDFKKYWANLSAEQKKVFVPCKGDKRWAYHVEPKKIEPTKVEPKKQGKEKLQKRHVVCIDPKHFAAGNLYNDDSRGLIYLKIAMATLARPLILIAKTIYHLTVGWMVAIARGVKNDESAKKICERIIRSFADILRTPIYELIMLIVGLVGILFAPIKMTFMYDIRAVIGKLTHELFWGSRKNPNMLFMLNPCMRRESNLVDEHLYRRNMDKNIPSFKVMEKKGIDEIKDETTKKKLEESLQLYRTVIESYEEERKKRVDEEAIGLSQDLEVRWETPVVPLNQNEQDASEQRFMHLVITTLSEKLPAEARSLFVKRCLAGEIPDLNFPSQ